MRISIIGLGYVGAVTGSALAEMGNEVRIVDIDQAKVDMMNDSRSPIPEPGLDELVADGIASGRLIATTSLVEAVAASDAVIISVGTPTDPVSGDPDLSAVRRVAVDIATSLRDREAPLLVAVSSTVPPGTTERLVRPILEQEGDDGRFSLCFLPEFLREGTAIDDFRNPTRFVIGARSEEEAEPFRELRSDIPERQHVVETEVAEMLKSAENCWHATKVTFANEISRVATANGVNPHTVMELLLADNKQNVSPAYLRPGFAFGGSCLPKDLRSVVRLAQNSGVSVPMLSGIPSSNEEHVEAAVRHIEGLGRKSIGILGLAFKAGTDDLRESPSIALAEALVGKGFEVRIHDYNARRHPSFGSNLNAWNRHEHLHNRMVDSVEELLAESEVTVLVQFNRRYVQALEELPHDSLVVDLSGLTGTVWAGDQSPLGAST